MYFFLLFIHYFLMFIICKSIPINQVAQTRLKNRSHRPDIESCNDPPHNRLLDEVAQLNETMMMLDYKITEAEAARLDLLANKQRLEEDIRVKVHSLRIDMEKCLTLR